MFIAANYLIWMALHFFVALLIPKIIPYLGNFAYPKDLLQFNLPKIIYSFANFDGAYYLRIARFGYQQYEQAFFPLYPILIRFFSFLLKNYLLSGLFISNICFLIGLFVFQQYLKMIKRYNRLIILLLLLFPTSFFFSAVYTESLFFLLTVLVFYLVNKKKYWPAIFFSFLAGLTRVNGIFLAIPFLLDFIKNFKKNKSLWPLGFGIISPFLGLLTYMRYLLLTTGDALEFFHVQSIFGPGRSTKLILLPQVFYRYFKIIFTAQPNFQYFISLLEIAVFSFVLIVLILDLFRNLKLKIKNHSLISLNLFSLANILLPTLTGSFLSIPRFSLLSLSFFVFLGSLENKRIKSILISLFFILHLILFGFFLQGWFVS